MSPRLFFSVCLLAAPSIVFAGAASPVSASPVEFATTSTTTPTPAPAPAPAFERANLLEALAADLGAHYALAELEVDLIRHWTPPAVGADAVPVTVNVIEYPEVLGPAMLVRVRYVQGKAILREDTLALRVSQWRDVMVAAVPLHRGDALSRQSMETRRVDALRDRDSLSVSLADSDYVLSRAIPAGRPLTWRDVMRRSLVQKGQMVEVSATDGALVITMKALAMQDGARGDAVRVRNVESKREFIARVIAENRAEVRF